MRKFLLILSITIFFLSLIFLRHHFSIFYFQNDINRISANIETQNIGDIYVCFDKNCDLMKYKNNVYSYELNQQNHLFYNNAPKSIEFILNKSKLNFSSISIFYNLDNLFYLSKDEIKKIKVLKYNNV